MKVSESERERQRERERETVCDDVVLCKGELALVLSSAAVQCAHSRTGKPRLCARASEREMYVSGRERVREGK